jgi:hypothetical protein
MMDRIRAIDVFRRPALSSNYPIVEYSRTGFIKDTTCTNKKGIIDTWIKRLL